MRTFLAALAVAVTLPLSAPAQTAKPDIVAEARAFMDAYAKDLASGDRAAIAARYDRQGAYFLVGGGREFAPHTAIVQNYARDWRPPTSFAWKDLNFDPIGSEAVVVNGLFAWGSARGRQTFTYTGFLRRQDGQLRIRLEDETPVSAPH